MTRVSGPAPPKPGFIAKNASIRMRAVVPKGQAHPSGYGRFATHFAAFVGSHARPIALQTKSLV